MQTENKPTEEGPVDIDSDETDGAEVKRDEYESLQR